jgi:hypothetical protein
MRVDGSQFWLNKSLAADATSATLDVTQMLGYAVQLVWTGATADGTFTLEASVDGANWELIPGSTVIASGPGSTIYNVTISYYRYVRVQFVWVAGTGVVNGHIIQKGL